ncbi:hypothetical protein PC128_g6742 [Phytophthora cactorum]|nr:hypothetical protein PC128_g6742 [Phytophthora cactorum]
MCGRSPAGLLQGRRREESYHAVESIGRNRVVGTTDDAKSSICSTPTEAVFANRISRISTQNLMCPTRALIGGISPSFGRRSNSTRNATNTTRFSLLVCVDWFASTETFSTMMDSDERRVDLKVTLGFNDSCCVTWGDKEMAKVHTAPAEKPAPALSIALAARSVERTALAAEPVLAVGRALETYAATVAGPRQATHTAPMSAPLPATEPAPAARTV